MNQSSPRTTKSPFVTPLVLTFRGKVSATEAQQYTKSVQEALGVKDADVDFKQTSSGYTSAMGLDPKSFSMRSENAHPTLERIFADSTKFTVIPLRDTRGEFSEYVTIVCNDFSPN